MVFTVLLALASGAGGGRDRSRRRAFLRWGLMGRRSGEGRVISPPRHARDRRLPGRLCDSDQDAHCAMPPEAELFCLPLAPLGCDGLCRMARTLLSPCLWALGIALLGYSLGGGAQAGPNSGSRASPDVSANPLNGPGGVYAKIPARDEFGRDQLAMFRMWNPDPVGNHEANLRSLHPALARVVRKAMADNPDLHFVIGSGRRDSRLQRMAVAWGWSRTQDSPHRSGRAVDLWPLDREGRVSFDPQAQNRLAAALRKAATELGVPVRWGGRFHGFKDMDRSHFELALS
jgi:peptidoglycan LD-endopeptidase CwlK